MYLYKICMRIYSEDLRIKKVPEKFYIVSSTFEHSARVNEQARVFKSMLPWMQSGPCVIRPFNFRLKSKIDVNFEFSSFFIIKKYGSAKSKIFDFFPFVRILKHNAYFYFNPVNNEEKNQTERQFCFSDNVAVCGMAKCFCFRRKSKNLKLKIAYWSGDKHTNHEASVLTLWVAHKNITAAFYNREICCLLGSFLVEGSPECKILLKSYQGIFLWKQWCGIFSVSSKYGACSDETFFYFRVGILEMWKLKTVCCQIQ